MMSWLFSKPDYPIVYTRSFVLFWGIGLGAAVFCGGLLALATALIILLMLIHHEHAHTKTALKHNAKIESIVFGAFGGILSTTPKHAHEEIDIYAAGVINSAGYAITALLCLGCLRGLCYQNGWNLADPSPLGLLYWFQFLNSISLAAVVLVISNVLPIWYHSKKHGLVTTDGFAVVLKWGDQKEWWNDGRAESMDYLSEFYSSFDAPQAY